MFFVKVKCFFVDEGRLEILTRDQLFEIKEEHLKLKFQVKY
jgi:hypothetical protein